METAISTITIFPSNDAELKTYISTIKAEILSGSVDPLLALKQLKFVEKTIDNLLKDAELDSLFIEEVEKYGKTTDHLGAKFSIQEVGVKYNYADCGDSEYSELVSSKKRLDDKIKDREGFLKAVPEDGMVNPETGEMIYRATKTSTTKVVVRL